MKALKIVLLLGATLALTHCGSKSDDTPSAAEAVKNFKNAEANLAEQTGCSFKAKDMYYDTTQYRNVTPTEINCVTVNANKSKSSEEATNDAIVSLSSFARVGNATLSSNLDKETASAISGKVDAAKELLSMYRQNLENRLAEARRQKNLAEQARLKNLENIRHDKESLADLSSEIVQAGCVVNKDSSEVTCPELSEFKDFAKRTEHICYIDSSLDKISDTSLNDKELKLKQSLSTSIDPICNESFDALNKKIDEVVAESDKLANQIKTDFKLNSIGFYYASESKTFKCPSRKNFHLSSVVDNVKSFDCEGKIYLKYYPEGQARYDSLSGKFVLWSLYSKALLQVQDAIKTLSPEELQMLQERPIAVSASENHSQYTFNSSVSYGYDGEYNKAIRINVELVHSTSLDSVLKDFLQQAASKNSQPEQAKKD